jgi:hypothetical protein
MEAHRWAQKRRVFFSLKDLCQIPARNRFIETAATVAIGEDRLTVAIDRRSHKPILREAAPDRDPLPIPQTGGRKLVFTYR